MKIAIIGATGGTGRKVMELALAAGHEVIAVVRRPEALSPAAGLTIRQGDVFDRSSMILALAGSEAVISCIGPPSNFSPDAAGKKGFVNLKAGKMSWQRTSRRVPSCQKEFQISLQPVGIMEFNGW